MVRLARVSVGLLAAQSEYLTGAVLGRAQQELRHWFGAPSIRTGRSRPKNIDTGEVRCMLRRLCCSFHP